MRSIVAIAISATFALTAPNAFALQKGHGPKVKATAPAPKAHAPQGPKVQGPKVQAQGPKAKPAGTPKVGSHGPKAQAKGTARTSPATVTTANSTTLTPVQQKLQRNTNLASKLEGRLPAGTNLMTAAEGFRNLGQFVAAVNVSNNLGIRFVDLKMRMVEEGMSLGQAIKVERPNVDSTTEVRRAETDATRVIESTETTTAGKKKTKGRG